MSNELDKEVVATGGDTAQNTGSDQNQDLGATNSAPTSPTNKIGLFNAMNSPFPLANTTRAMLNGGIIVTPPNPSGGDRTREDRDRHKDRIRDQIKPQLPGIIGTTPIFGDGGKVKVPVKGGYEPKWRYGRDPKGGGGGGGGEAGDNAGELIYVEISMEELIEMLFADMELPDMLKKQLATTKVKTYKYRGVQPNGPKPRLRKNDTAKARIRRAIGMKNAQPEAYQHVTTHIPTIQDVPFHKQDERYHRVDETFDEDSKCVVFFVLDRSGSMGGDPLMIAKAYFLLNLMFLRTKYKDVTVVMIAHDGQAYRIRDEELLRDRGGRRHAVHPGLPDDLGHRPGRVPAQRLEPVHVPCHRRCHVRTPGRSRRLVHQAGQGQLQLPRLPGNRSGSLGRWRWLANRRQGTLDPP